MKSVETTSMPGERVKKPGEFRCSWLFSSACVKTLLCLGAVLGSSLTANATLVLSEGQSYEYEFSNLPYAFGIWQGIGSGTGGLVTITLESNQFDPAGLRIEMFQHSSSATPFFSGTGTVRDDTTLVHAETSMWDDKEGKVRLTAVSGDFAIKSVQVDARVGTLHDGTFYIDFYERKIDPVPEPGTTGLVLSAGLLLLNSFGRRARSREHSLNA